MQTSPQEPFTKARRLRHLLLVAIGQEEIGERVRIAREEAGLTQQELAEGAGLKNGANISRIERGETQLTPKRMRRIAEATKKPLTFFVQDLEARRAEAPREESELGAVQATLADLARAVEVLAGEQRRQADEIAELRQELGPTLRRAQAP